MKSFNFWRSLFFSALAVMSFSACSDDDNSGSGDVDAAITVNGEKAAMLGIKGEGGETEAVSVVSSGAWTLAFEEEQDWCVASATAGNGGTSTLTFTVAPMPADVEERSATAVLSTPGQVFGVPYFEKATISIRQSASGSAVPETNVAAIRALLVAMNPTATKTDVTEELAAMTITGIVGSEASGINMGDVYYAAVQDDTQEKNSGLTLSCNAFSSMNLSAGTIVSAPLTGAQVQTYGGAVQLLLNSSAEVQTWTGTAPEPIVVTPDALSDYEAMVVKIENCYPTSNIGEAWYNTTSKGNVNFVTVDGHSFVGYMGSKATPINTTIVPDKMGSLIGIAGDYNGTKQVKPRTVADIQLTEAIPEPEYKSATIAEIETEGNYEVQATVVATYAVGFIMQDATGAMLVFLNTAPEVAVGDAVTVKGTVAPYGGALQFGEGTTVEKTGTAEPAAVEAVTITADNIGGYMTKPVVTFIKMTGTLVKSGNYYNVEFPFESNYKGSISSPNAALNIDTYVGNIVDIEGWFVNNGNKGGTGTYFTVVATKVDNNTEIPVLKFTSTPKAFLGNNPEPQTITFTTQNIAADALVEFTFTGENADKFDVQKEGDNSVTIKAVGNNTSDADYTATLVASLEGTTLATLAVEQEVALADGTKEVEIVCADLGYDNAFKVTSITGFEPLAFTISKASGSTDPAFYTATGAIRFYAGTTLTISGATILKVEFTFVTTSTDPDIYNHWNPVSPGTYSGSEWTGEASEVVFTSSTEKDSSNKNVQTRVLTIKVTYKE